MAIEERSERYLRILLLLLIPAAFFNGFDGELRALLAPQLQRAFHVSLGTLGLANVPIAAGSFIAFFAIRLADRVGRRPLLLVGLFGYALFTGLTATSWSVWSFVLFQSLTQIFAGTEFALAAIVVLEEFPIATRGRALGKLLLAVPLGTAATAVLLGAGLQHTVLGWRSFYLVGVLPAFVIGVARRYVRETAAFTEARKNRPTKEPMSAALVRPWRRRVLALGFVSLLVKIPVTAGAGWWVYYAEREHHFSTGLVSVDLGTAVILGTVGYYVCGRLIDRYGRKPVATVYFLAACASGVALFHSSTEAANFVFLILAVFFGLGVGPALSAMSAESFPTRIRAQASAIVGNGFANTGEVTGGSIVGVLSERGGLIGNIGDTVSVLTVLLLAALPILWRFVPETKGTRLDAVPEENA
ncbi:MAG TPA: MFS transporter [Acidimicrobiales bacterium]|nr:MFS transporter [Acidimicrobiales bacterium]